MTGIDKLIKLGYNPGRVHISHEYLVTHPDKMLLILREIIPIELEFSLFENTLKYIALSKKFEPLELGHMCRRYDAVIQNNVVSWIKLDQ